MELLSLSRSSTYSFIRNGYLLSSHSVRNWNMSPLNAALTGDITGKPIIASPLRLTHQTDNHELFICTSGFMSRTTTSLATACRRFHNLYNISWGAFMSRTTDYRGFIMWTTYPRGLSWSEQQPTGGFESWITAYRWFIDLNNNHPVLSWSEQQPAGGLVIWTTAYRRFWWAEVSWTTAYPVWWAEQQPTGGFMIWTTAYRRFGELNNNLQAVLVSCTTAYRRFGELNDSLPGSDDCTTAYRRFGEAEQQPTGGFVS